MSKTHASLCLCGRELASRDLPITFATTVGDNCRLDPVNAVFAIPCTESTNQDQGKGGGGAIELFLLSVTF
jgi:hypothetical protein